MVRPFGIECWRQIASRDEYESEVLFAGGLGLSANMQSVS
jgi:hypothetical protein